MKPVNSQIVSNKLAIIITSLLICVSYAYGQPSLPTRSIEVFAIQSLQFGEFVVTGGAGGSVLVGYDGNRSATNSIALLSSGQFAQPAIFEIKLLQGRNVNVSFAPTTTLSDGKGGLLTLNIGPTEKGNSGAYFSTNNTRDFTTTLSVGGKLDVPGGAVPGTYTGSFSITFNQE